MIYLFKIMVFHRVGTDDQRWKAQPKQPSCEAEVTKKWPLNRENDGKMMMNHRNHGIFGVPYF